MRYSISRLRWSAAPLGLTLLACGGDGPTAAEEPPPDPETIVMVSGDGQEGKAGEELAEPFVVRVTDAQGNAVEGVQVIWTVTSGGGDFGTFAGEPLSTAGSNTDQDGISEIFFRPTVLGSSTVSAGLAGFQGSPVTFTTNVDVVVIGLGPLFDCGPTDPFFFLGPDGSSDVTVPVGTPVEWVPSCEARIAATSEPSGGEPFDSGVLDPGERFRFVPGVAGTWEFEDQISGATGTLTAR